MNTIPEKELKDRCTIDDIKRMVELAEGFEYQGDDEIFYNSLRVDKNILLFPLLIRRAVDGYNKKYAPDIIIDISARNLVLWKRDYIHHPGSKKFYFQNYQKENLTQAECACLHCLLDIFND